MFIYQFPTDPVSSQWQFLCYDQIVADGLVRTQVSADDINLAGIVQV